MIHDHSYSLHDFVAAGLSKYKPEQLSICYDENDLTPRIESIFGRRSFVPIIVHGCERSNHDYNYDCHTGTTPSIDCDKYFVIERYDRQRNNGNNQIDYDEDSKGNILVNSFNYNNTIAIIVQTSILTFFVIVKQIYHFKKG